MEFKETLQASIETYRYPATIFDFQSGLPRALDSMADVEQVIFRGLTAHETMKIKSALANIVYWGNVQRKYAGVRLNEGFMARITDTHVNAFRALLDASERNPSAVEIKRLGIPYFSGMSFISKVKMFLDPKKYGVLDLQIMKLKFTEYVSVLSEINYVKRRTSIVVSEHNSYIYEKFCGVLTEIAKENFGETARAVDIERGLFGLIQNGQIDQAARILSRVNLYNGDVR